MRYLCLISQDVGRSVDLRQQLRQTRDERLAVDEELRQRGLLIAAAVLQPGAAAATVRARGSALLVAECLPDQQTTPLVALYLLDARDLNEVIRLVAQLPLGRLGCVEIRALEEA